MKKLQRKIMRGVYYAYAIRLATLPGVWQSFVMLAALAALTRFVSIGHVIQNFSGVQVGHIGTFFYNAVRTTEIWTLLLIGVLVFLSLSLRISLFAPRREYSFARV